MKWQWSWEPTLVLGLVRAILVLLTVFGVALNDTQFAAIYVVFEIVVSIINRQLVTPVAKEDSGARRL